jgi:uncharacterized repeat protein (TIGR04138 family)
MNKDVFAMNVRNICAKDKRYKPDAYFFIQEGFNFAARMFKKRARKGHSRHLTAHQFLEGLRIFALEEFGPMARRVLKEWGLNTTQDIGEVVFNLIEAGSMKKAETDSKEDFINVYDFDEAFVKPFLPSSKINEKRNEEAKK